jgi:hypothetical protein
MLWYLIYMNLEYSAVQTVPLQFVALVCLCARAHMDTCTNVNHFDVMCNINSFTLYYDSMMQAVWKIWCSSVLLNDQCFVLRCTETVYCGAPRLCTAVHRDCVLRCTETVYCGAPRLCTAVHRDCVLRCTETVYWGAPRLCTGVHWDFI